MKKILALILVLVTVISTNVFAYTWVEKDGGWYVIDEGTKEFTVSTLIDTGDAVYYLDDSGKMVTGWWQHPTTKKYYFFDNFSMRNYGAMVFGLHTVDGYYRYFGDDGTLQTADTQGTYKKVYGEFWADDTGKLYFNNEVLRDVTVQKSDYYSNEIYYTNQMLNNYYLANFDKVTKIDFVKPVEVGTGQSINGSVVTARANLTTVQTGENKKNTESNATGGTNYYIDNLGRIVAPDETGTISSKEIYGPAAKE